MVLKNIYLSNLNSLQKIQFKADKIDINIISAILSKISKKLNILIFDITDTMLVETGLML